MPARSTTPHLHCCWRALMLSMDSVALLHISDTVPCRRMPQGKDDVVLIDVPDEAWLSDFGEMTLILLRHCRQSCSCDVQAPLAVLLLLHVDMRGHVHKVDPPADSD